MCNRLVTAMYRRNGEEVLKECGTSFGGTRLMCDRCEKRAIREFPQGWKFYPGDVCEHGRYVGGCGADLMCSACEMGA